MAKKGFMPPNMNNMLKQVQKMQKEMEKTQRDLEEKVFEASVGGGAVVVKANGKKEVLDIQVKEEVVDPDDVEMLQDLILTAVNEALRLADDAMSKQMSKISGGMPGLF